MNNTNVFVTTALNENEAIGAMVLAESLRKTGTTKDICVLIGNDLSQQTRQVLSRFFDHVTIITFDDILLNDIIKSRPELQIPLFKLYCWNLPFSKCVYLEPSCLVMQNVDELFERDEFSAAPDAMWPDYFNSGVYVFEPSEKIYSDLITLSQTSAISEKSSQCILNHYFKNWATEDISKHLPFIYNVTPNVFYTYQPALKSFSESVKIMQFKGEPKPWNTILDITAGVVSNVVDSQQQYYKHWWNIFNASVKPILDGLEKEIVHLCEYIKTAACVHEEQPIVGSDAHKSAWERGEIDYLGKDSFDKIKETIEKSIN